MLESLSINDSRLKSDLHNLLNALGSNNSLTALDIRSALGVGQLYCCVVRTQTSRWTTVCLNCVVHSVTVLCVAAQTWSQCDRVVCCSANMVTVSPCCVLQRKHGHSVTVLCVAAQTWSQCHRVVCCSANMVAV